MARKKAIKKKTKNLSKTELEKQYQELLKEATSHVCQMDDMVTEIGELRHTNSELEKKVRVLGGKLNTYRELYIDTIDRVIDAVVDRDSSLESLSKHYENAVLAGGENS